MRQWRTTPALRVSLHVLTRRHNSLQCRWFSSQHHVETVAVPCASSGSIDVNLHNLSQHHPSHPLVICLPPFFQTGHTSAPQLPAFLKSYPSAVINYRWLDPSSTEPEHVGNDESSSSLFPWPSPIHDTLFGYSWILKNLSPPGDEKRDIYVYGSYLGASLAASLALTESHQDQRMAVRGLLTYNGIYNWTMFLPDHPIHQRKSLLADASDDSSYYAEGSFFHYLRSNLPVLFPSPSALFDPFASPSLFFRDPGLWVPEDFTTSATASPMTRAIDALSSASTAWEDDTDSSSTTTTWTLKPPRKSYLTFPPWASSLKLPPTLLLHESPPPRGTRKRRTAALKTTTKKRKAAANTFEGQAAELAELMRRSVERYELGGDDNREGGGGGGDESTTTGEGRPGGETEAEKRVRTRDVGAVEGDGSLGGLGQDVAAAWLGERIGR